jgi:RimJ/RimL family protein N-acetyltransferase
MSIIYGERIRFRRPERTDLELFVEWVNDPEVTENLSLYLPMAFWEEEAWFDALSKRPPTERPLVIETRESEGWRAIGNCGYHQVDTITRSGEVGIMIGDKSVWNQGYGTEAMRLLVKHGFETLNLNRVQLLVYDNNIWAIRTYEKVGFVHEGRQRQAMYKNGMYKDILMMSILRSEWESGQK